MMEPLLGDAINLRTRELRNAFGHSWRNSEENTGDLGIRPNRLPGSNEGRAGERNGCALFREAEKDYRLETFEEIIKERVQLQHDSDLGNLQSREPDRGAGAYLDLPGI